MTREAPLTNMLEIICCPLCKSNLAHIKQKLLCKKCKISYPIFKGIPIFLKKPLENKEKINVKDFYENFGWKKTINKNFCKNEAVFDDTRQIGLKYVSLSILKEKSLFSKGGKYFLDCASGPIAYKEYLELSSKYKFHVCVDFSITALLKAKQKLGSRGLYINADISSLPFKKNAFDAILCSHALYHLPKNQQRKTLNDLYRILKTNKKLVIVYDVGNNSIVSRLSNFFIKEGSNKINAPSLFSYKYPANWFKKSKNKFKKIQIRSHRLLNKNLSLLIPNNFLGYAIIYLINSLEKMFSSFLAKFSPYITVIVYK